MKNPNDVGNTTDSKTSETNWDDVAAEAGKMGTVYKAGEVSKIFEKDGDYDLISKYYLEEQNGESQKYDEKMATFIANDAISLDLDQNIIKQLSEKGNINPAELDDIGRKFYDDTVYHLQILSDKQFRDQARTILNQIKDIGMVGDFMSRLFDEAVKIADQPKTSSPETDYETQMQKESFDELEQRFNEVTDLRNGSDSEELENLYYDYNKLLEYVTDDDMARAIGERKQKLGALLDEHQKLVSRANDLF